jgi:N-terminal domain of anti-restriction factor ArdC
VRASREQMQQEALSRAASGQSLTNWPAIIHGFIAKGIPEADIRPRENVFTYHAWRALGRQVRRGEHGVKVTTFVPVKTDAAEQTDADEGKARNRRFGRPWTATVFHVSQTDAVQA